MYPEQLDAIFCSERYGLVEASTKSGKTVGCISWIVEQALGGQAGWNYWWIAPGYNQAEIAYRRIKLGLTKGSFVAFDTPTPRISLINGAWIWFKSADNADALYGEDVYAAVVDEASRCAETSWHAIRSTLTATRGPVRIIGNVKGRKNWFYNLARRAEAEMLAQPNAALRRMHYACITADDAVAAGVLDAGEIEDARDTLPVKIFRELYYAEPGDDTGNPFGLDHIRACTVDGLAAGPVVAWGIDLAKSQDYFVCIGLNDMGEVAAFHRWNRTPWRNSIRQVWKLVGEDAPALVDSTGVGDPVLEELQFEHGNFTGYHFSATSKQKLMEGLAVSIQSREIKFPKGYISQELEMFEYEFKPSGVRYCLAPETPVLTADLRWISVESLETGDKLIGFDEEPLAGAKTRKWKEAEVTDTAIILRPCYKIAMSDGTTFTCSAEHKWLVDVGNGPLIWKMTSELRGIHEWSISKRFAPHKLVKVCDTWQTDRSYFAGYLAGAFDVDGSLSQQDRNDNGGKTTRLSFAQRENEMSEMVRDCLMALDFYWSENTGGGTNNDVTNFSVTGRNHSVMKFLGVVRPPRLLANFSANNLGTMWSTNMVSIAKIEYIGERAVVALGTSTKTLIANGYATHNSAPEGQYDDCVCALALARQMWTQVAPGENIMKYYATTTAKLREIEEKLPEDNNRPWQDNTGFNIEIGDLGANELEELYNEVVAQHLPSASRKCVVCSQPVLGSARVTDGELYWHVACAGTRARPQLMAEA